MNKLTFIAALFLLGCSSKIQTSGNETSNNSTHLMYYHAPAESWIDALPVGNGRLGAMIFGNPGKERIQLNENSMWPGDNGWGLMDGNKNDLNDVRQLVIDGKNQEADALFVKKFLTHDLVRSHQTMGDLSIDFGDVNYSNYTRSLDLANATAKTEYSIDDKKVQQTVFASNPDDVLVIHYNATNKDGLTATLSLSRPKDNGHQTAKSFTENNSLVMQGEVTQYGGVFLGKKDPIKNGVKFDTRLKVNNDGGSVVYTDTAILLKNVKTFTIYLVSNTSYYHKDYIEKSKAQLTKVSTKNVTALHKTHVADYKSLADRMYLDIENETVNLPTNERLERVKKGAIDVGLEELLFNYGRYLLISSSRKGYLPTNLQGIWNDDIEAPWNADFHLNINIQMNYWLANMTNLDETNLPLFDYIDKLVETGKVAAEKNFGCRGSFIPHASDIWATSFLRARTAFWGASFGAGGWLMQHYWNHYLYTQDAEFLKTRAFPAMQEVAKFYADWVIKDPKTGKWVSAPSSSPENSFTNEAGHNVAVCLGSAKDQQVIFELFTNYLKAAEILNINNEWTELISDKLKNLRSGTQVGSDGRLLEWDKEYKEPEPGHRHMSHLYAFHPGNQITHSQTPDLVEAVKKSMAYRIKNGGGHTGWSRAWLINLQARMLDGELAHESIVYLIRKSIVLNLFDMHPPFQIDGNFGYTSGVSEMLLQSHDPGLIRILPALPKAWKTGNLKGMKARGNIEADFSWKDGVVTKLTLSSPNAQSVKVMVNGKELQVDLKAGAKNQVL